MFRIWFGPCLQQLPLLSLKTLSNQWNRNASSSLVLVVYKAHNLHPPHPKPTHPHSPCRHDSLPYPLFSFHSWLPMRQLHACGHRTPQSSTDHFRPSVNVKTRLILSSQQEWQFVHCRWQEPPTVVWSVRPDLIDSGRKINIKHICRLRLSQAPHHLSGHCWVPLPSVNTQCITERITLTSTIILQLLQGPICVKTCTMRGSVTSLDRFPTYLETRREMGELSLCQTGSSMQTKAS